MRKATSLVVLLLLFSGLCMAGVKENVAKTIVRVRSGNKYSSGFFWNNGNTVLTTLHSLSDVNDIYICRPGTSDWIKTTLKKVYKSSDLISLHVGNYTSDDFLTDRYYSRPSVDTRAFTVGYNSGSSSYIDKDFTVGLLEGNTLKDLLPRTAQTQINNLGFPSISTQIIYLKGNLLHGFSGSPIVDFQGKLMGIADGGLENGAAGISWCINSTHISNLESSTESVPYINQSSVNSLFAAEEYEEKESDDPGIEINQFTFKKVKTRTFAELDRTGSYSTFREMGLDQLIAKFQQSGIRYNDFEYDVYVEQTTGATVVVPAGTELMGNNEILTASSDDRNFNLVIRLENTYNIQQSSLNFEAYITRITNTYNWTPDMRLSYLGPLFRPDNVVINRKAFFTPTGRYGFETIAGKQSTFLGVFVTIDNQLNPMTMMFANQPEVAKYNLALQLTTFTN